MAPGTHPLVASRQRALLESWQESGHHHARFARPAWPKNSQQPRSVHTWLINHQHFLHLADEFRSKGVASKEISGIVPGEGTQSLVWIAGVAQFADWLGKI